jgi:hypothetical protein
MQEEVKSQQGPKRPFLEYWEALEKLELQRRKGYIADCRYVMTLAFIDHITPERFLEEAADTFAVQEIARFYDIELDSVESLSDFLNCVRENSFHREILYYSFYFAAWVKQEVPSS